MEPTQAIRGRRSRRRFRGDPVPEAAVRDILECARLAPTARNVQPWLVGAVLDPGLRSELARLADHGKFIDQAPVCFAVFALGSEKYFLEDGCACTMNVIHAAEAHGLGSCWVAGHGKPYGEAVRRLLDVPEGYTLVSLVPVGHPADDPHPQKKALEEVAFRDRYRPAG